MKNISWRRREEKQSIGVRAPGGGSAEELLFNIGGPSRIVPRRGQLFGSALLALSS